MFSLSPGEGGVYHFGDSELHLDFPHVAHVCGNYFHCCEEVIGSLEVRREHETAAHVIQESDHPLDVPDTVSHMAACALMWTHDDSAHVSWAERGEDFSLCHKNGFSTPEVFLPSHSPRVMPWIISLSKLRDIRGNQTLRKVNLFCLFSEIISWFCCRQSWL